MKEEDYKFDKLEFIPQQADIPAQFAPLYLMATQNGNVDGLGGIVFAYDLHGKDISKPKFTLPC